MELLINLIVWIVVFAIVAYGIHWVCIRFALPQPIMWIAGALLLIVLLLFLSHQLGVGSGTVLRRPV